MRLLINQKDGCQQSALYHNDIRDEYHCHAWTCKWPITPACGDYGSLPWREVTASGAGVFVLRKKLGISIIFHIVSFFHDSRRQ